MCAAPSQRPPAAAVAAAGKPEHFSEVFHRTKASAGLAAGIFHRREVPIAAVKAHMVAEKIPTRA
jgi:glutamine amidotransferase/cyclase